MPTDTERSRNVTERKMNDPVMQKRRGQGTYEEIKKKRYLEEMEKVWSKKEKLLRDKEMKLKKLAIRENVEENKDDEEAEEEMDEQKEERERKELEVTQAVKRKNGGIWWYLWFVVFLKDLRVRILYKNCKNRKFFKNYFVFIQDKQREEKEESKKRKESLQKFDTLLRVDPTIDDEHTDEFIIPRGAEKVFGCGKGGTTEYSH